MRLFAYVVRYDSGFAPNPFHGVCTLATCKPDIRKSAIEGDWILGTASNAKGIRLGGHVVHLMRVSSTMSFNDYWADERFRMKKPNLRGSKKNLCGDNIYRWDAHSKSWQQLDSFHRRKDGSPNEKHIAKDTSVDRVLISDDFVYYGAAGPRVPEPFDGIYKRGIGERIETNAELIAEFVKWARSLERWGYVGTPYDWPNIK